VSIDNAMPRIRCRSLKKLKNMAARLRERAAFANCYAARSRAVERLRFVEEAIIRKL